MQAPTTRLYSIPTFQLAHREIQLDTGLTGLAPGQSALALEGWPQASPGLHWPSRAAPQASPGPGALAADQPCLALEGCRSSHFDESWELSRHVVDLGLEAKVGNNGPKFSRRLLGINFSSWEL